MQFHRLCSNHLLDCDPPRGYPSLDVMGMIYEQVPDPLDCKVRFHSHQYYKIQQPIMLAWIVLQQSKNGSGTAKSGLYGLL